MVDKLRKVDNAEHKQMYLTLLICFETQKTFREAYLNQKNFDSTVLGFKKNGKLFLVNSQVIR